MREGLCGEEAGDFLGCCSYGSLSPQHGIIGRKEEDGDEDGEEEEEEEEEEKEEGDG